MHPLEQLRDEALREIDAAPDERSLEGIRVKYLGKSGSISEWGERMKTLGKEERPVVGKLLNQARNSVSAALNQRGEKVCAEKESDALSNIDVSLPGASSASGYSCYSGYTGYSNLTGYSGYTGYSNLTGYSGYAALERGSLHPLTQMLERSIGIFRRMGFALADGPDIEDEW